MALNLYVNSAIELATAAAYTLRVELCFAVVFSLVWLGGRYLGLGTKGSGGGKLAGRKATPLPPQSCATARRRPGAPQAAAASGRRSNCGNGGAEGPEQAPHFSNTDLARYRDGAWLTGQITHMCRSQVQRAMELYRNALQYGLDLRQMTGSDLRQLTLALVTSAIRVGQPEEAMRVFKDLRRQGLEVPISLFTSATKLCTSKQLFSECLALFDFVAEDPKLNVDDRSVWSCLLFCAVEAKDFKRCKGLFAKLQDCGEPSNKDYGNMVRFAAACSDWELALKLIEDMRAVGVEIDSVVYNTALATCVGSEQVDRAAQLLEDMEKAGGVADVITYNTLAKGFAKAGRLQQCFGLFEVMRERGIEPSQVTYGILLDGCINENQVEKAAEVFEAMKREGCQMNTVLYTTLIKGFARAGQVDQATRLYEQMRVERNVHPDLITFSVLIKANCDCGNLNASLKLLEAMQELNLKPDEVVFNNLLGGCVREGNALLAKQLYQDMVKAEIRPSNATFSILIRLYAQCKLLDEAVDMLRTEPATRGVDPEPRLFAQLAQCCLRERQGRRAVEVYKMLLERSTPTAAVHGSLLGMCVKLNMVETGVEILNLAAAAQGRVDARDAACLLDAAVRKRKSHCAEAVRAATERLGLPTAVVA